MSWNSHSCLWWKAIPTTDVFYDLFGPFLAGPNSVLHSRWRRGIWGQDHPVFFMLNVKEPCQLWQQKSGLFWLQPHLHSRFFPTYNFREALQKFDKCAACAYSVEFLKFLRKVSHTSIFKKRFTLHNFACNFGALLDRLYQVMKEWWC